MSNREIVVENLVKRYGDFVAVDGISLKVNAGEIFGFLGPNGAGKSTLVKILTTLATQSEGRATVGGFDIVKQAEDVRRIAGVALQEIGIDPIMKSMELLTIQGQLFGMSRKRAQQRGRELLDLVKLSDVTERLAGKYSGGMRRRLDLALALVHEPDVLFLDEPTTGLDPASRRDIWTEVQRLNEQLGITVFLTTQYLEEADLLANRIAIINTGKIVAEGTPAELKTQIGAESINLSFADQAAVQKASTLVSDMVERLQQDGTVLRLYLSNAAQAVPAVMTRLSGEGLTVNSLTLSQPTLDDVFLQVTGTRYDSDAATANSTDNPDKKPAKNRRAS